MIYPDRVLLIGPLSNDTIGPGEFMVLRIVQHPDVGLPSHLDQTTFAIPVEVFRKIAVAFMQVDVARNQSSPPVDIGALPSFEIDIPPGFGGLRD